MPTSISRRAFLGSAASTLGVAAATASGLLSAETLFARPADAATIGPRRLPEIQFDFGPYIAPAQEIGGVQVRFGPLYTLFLPATLTRTPSFVDQVTLTSMLDAVEAHYPYSPSGVMGVIAYGLPYFARFRPQAVAEVIPTTTDGSGQPALIEAVPGPTDVTVGGSVTKATFNVPVVIEKNELLVSLRSDSLEILHDVAAFLAGSGRLGGRPLPLRSGIIKWGQARLMFVQPGLPRQIADQQGLSYAADINPQSPMWMGFSSQQTNGSGPAAIATFAGDASAHLTNAQAGDYFGQGAVQHFSHSILDMAKFYSKPFEDYTERCGYMFRSNPVPAPQTGDGFTDGGGTAWIANTYNGVNDAASNASGAGTANGQPAYGHLNALQRVSRAADGTPIHVRMDGTGFDTLDVPDGSAQPKLQFSIFVPSAQFFAQMRTAQASTDLATEFNVSPFQQGIERFMTTTRRQNFLVPPRARRSFPLTEFFEGLGRPGTRALSR